MPFETSCPKGHRVLVDEADVGKQLACPTCSEVFAVSGPGGGGAKPAPAPPWTDLLDRQRLNHFSLLAGRPMVAIGLLLVLISRGCDGLGKRAVDRAQAKEKVAQASFNDKWDQQRTDIQRKISVLEDKESPSPEDSQTISDLKKSLADLQKNQEKAKKVFDATTLRDLSIAARDAAANNAINGYWRECLFVLASLVLAIGLLAVSWTAEGAERWVCLMMLAIITFNLYVAGVGWTPPGH
jgi:hypothetical protein